MHQNSWQGYQYPSIESIAGPPPTSPSKERQACFFEIHLVPNTENIRIVVGQTPSGTYVLPIKNLCHHSQYFRTFLRSKDLATSLQRLGFELDVSPDAFAYFVDFIRTGGLKYTAGTSGMTIVEVVMLARKLIAEELFKLALKKLEGYLAVSTYLGCPIDLGEYLEMVRTVYSETGERVDTESLGSSGCDSSKVKTVLAGYAADSWDTYGPRGIDVHSVSVLSVST
ncbi:hypothetical protein BJ508DRAFT_416540 [Ascobolus immersus RN42]|uniref:BTB domain-containing protein n=1 Tax=Ascobolus immersus RN42 TaxID=1160509 RepID=A0A3N4HXN4_ASCIM|nr:hypothetical protein BJ508DRAFT_416540 [Ascobolus immersus RN42]